MAGPEIQVTPENVKKWSGQFDTAGNNIGQAGNKINASIGQIKWTSQSRTQFDAKVKLYQAELQKLRVALGQFSRAMNDANTTYTTNYNQMQQKIQQQQVQPRFGGGGSGTP